MSVNETMLERVLEDWNEDLAECLTPHIEKFMLDHKDEICEKYEVDYCDHCEDFVEPEFETINGRVGHIDNWMPDDHVAYCPECSRGLE